jgi:hypothetical protein
LPGREASRILIEPSGRVVETLRLAMLDVGADELVRRTGSTMSLLEKWINGQEWIPLSIVSEACKINRLRRDAPPYSRTLSECTEGAQFRITAGEGVEKSEEQPMEVKALRLETPAERLEKPSVKPPQPGVSRQIVGVAIALFVAPLLGAAAGLLVAGPIGAVVGTISSFAAVVIFTFILLLSPGRHA